MTELQGLLCPRSIAIVGASADLNRVSGRPIRNLLRDGYAGRVMPVNPRHERIGGLPCYPDVESLPEVPDLGVVAVAAERAREAVDALGRKGVRLAMVWSAGFAEVGDAGRRLERELVAAARAHGMRICGPNTLGLTNAFERMPLTFSQYADTPVTPGPVAFVSQSGAFGTAMATSARERGIGLGYFISTGNQCDLSVADVVDAVLDDPRVRVVVAYLEGLGDGAAFLGAACKALRLRKPLVVVKVGRHAAGSRAAVSHTGSLAGDDAVFDSVIRQFGVIRAEDEEHALDLVAAFVETPVPDAGGVGLITISGGAGAMMADLAEELGLEVPVLADESQHRLRQVLRGFAATGNPVDVTGQVVEDVGCLDQSLEIVLDDARVALAVVWVQWLRPQAQRLVELLRARRQQAAKPFLVCWLNAPPDALAQLRDAGIFVTASTRGVIQAAAGLAAFGRHRHEVDTGWRALGTQAPEDAGPAGTEVVPSLQAAAMLEACGLPLVPVRLATDAPGAVQHARALGYPVAIKIESADLPHKTEAGGVRLDLGDDAAVARAFQDVMQRASAFDPAARIAGVLVQRMASPGTELVLGLRRDPVFGPLVMAGLGGVFIEALKDVVFVAPPFGPATARSAIARLRHARILEGFRGKPAVDVDALARAMCALGKLAARHPEVVELDLNPVLAGPDGTIAVDWLMVRRGVGGTGRH